MKKLRLTADPNRVLFIQLKDKELCSCVAAALLKLYPGILGCASSEWLPHVGSTLPDTYPMSGKLVVVDMNFVRVYYKVDLHDKEYDTRYDKNDYDCKYLIRFFTTDWVWGNKHHPDGYDIDDDDNICCVSCPPDSVVRNSPFMSCYIQHENHAALYRQMDYMKYIFDINPITNLEMWSDLFTEVPVPSQPLQGAYASMIGHADIARIAIEAYIKELRRLDEDIKTI